MKTPQLENKLTAKNIQPTAMRLLVLKQLVESKSAISLSELENSFESADKVTLYRTLKTFEKKKLIHSIDDGSKAVKYALCEENCECAPQDQHVHFHCEKCEETYCLTNTKIPSLNIPVAFQANSVNMVYKGVCSNCN
ncbi:transcriptional repressor [bacterium]|nr:transcriptional repressor [bacterium]